MFFYTQSAMDLEDEYEKDIDDFLDDEGLRQKYGDDWVNSRMEEDEDEE